jgi:HD superfamily phosphohydrolase
VVEQSLRLAALFHDLGHLPFSHDFEYALGRLFEDNPDTAQDRFGALYAGPDGEPGPAIHERIGYRLATALFHKLDETVFDGTEVSRLVRASVIVAQRILSTPAPDDIGLAVTPATCSRTTQSGGCYTG